MEKKREKKLHNTNTAMDPPPANSPTMYIRMVYEDQTIYFFHGLTLHAFWAKIANSESTVLAIFYFKEY